MADQAAGHGRNQPLAACGSERIGACFPDRTVADGAGDLRHGLRDQAVPAPPRRKLVALGVVPAFAATYFGLARTFGIPELDLLLARILPRRLSGRAN